MTPPINRRDLLKAGLGAGVTLSMKNLFGVVPSGIYGWPKNILHYHGIENSILDLNATIRPHFTIVDAVVAMEGDGPIMGKPRQTGFIAMGSTGTEGVLQRIAISAAARISSIQQVTRLSVLNASAGSLGINQRAHHSIDRFAASTRSNSRTGV